MAKILNAAGFTISGRIGKSQYIAANGHYRNTLQLRTKAFKPTEHNKKTGHKMHYAQTLYKAYRSAIRVGLPTVHDDKQQKIRTPIARFMQYNFTPAITAQTAMGNTTYTLNYEKLTFASGREALPANLQAVSAGGNVKVTWTPYAGDDPATKQQKIGIVVVSEDTPLKPILELGSKKRTDSECTVALSGLTGNLHAYVFVYDNTEGKRLSSAQAHFAL